MKNLNKYLLLIFLLVVFLILPRFTSAITIEELDAKIKNLEQQIEQLKTQITQLQNQLFTTPSITFEQVKCVFKGTQAKQTCYASEVDYSGYSCSGIESCLIDIKGWRKNTITWKSSCGGYAYTTMDSQNETVEFNCAVSASINIISPNGGEKWEVGKTYPIKWESVKVEKVAIELVGPETKQKIIVLSDNPGFYNWTIGSDIVPNDKYKIQVTAYDTYLSVSDLSNDYFSIIPLIPPKITGKVIQFVVADEYNIYAVMDNGSVFCWIARPEKMGSTPTKIFGLDVSVARAAVAVSSLGPLSCAIFQDLENVAYIAPGSNHSCVVKKDGSAFCWGRNEYGQLGDGTDTDRETPTLVSGLGPGTTVAIAVGGSFTCALKKDKSVVCWGNNNNGQLGDGTLEGKLTPTPVSGLGPGTTLALLPTDSWSYMNNGGCALKTNSSLVCWGENHLTGFSANITPVQVSHPQLALGTIKSLSGFGFKSSCALKKDDSVVCTGTNYCGQSGNNQGKNKFTLGPGTTVAVSTGPYHSCALKKDGSVVCWGCNEDGKVGDGTRTNRLTPVQIPGLGPGTTAAISVSGYRACALKTDNSVVCWPGEKGKPASVIGLKGSVSSIVPMTNILGSVRRALEQIFKLFRR